MNNRVIKIMNPEKFLSENIILGIKLLEIFEVVLS